MFNLKITEMRKYILFFSALVFMFQACSEDDELLSPSLADEDRAIVYADMTKPVVKRLVDGFNCGLLYEYDANLDFRYTSESIGETQKWNGIKLPTIKEDRFTDQTGNSIESFEYNIELPSEVITINSYDQHVDAALQFLDTTLFAYFEVNSKIAGLFPKKVLVASKLTASRETAVMALTESDSRVSSSTAQKALRSVYNRNSIVFNGSMKDVAPSYKKYRNDNFYVFLIRMMEMHDLYDEFPDSLFEAKEQYYKENIGSVYGLDEPYKTYPKISHNWYHELGFIDTKYLTKQELKYTYDYTTKTYINPIIKSSSGFGSGKRIYPKHMFPADRIEDIKMFLNELIHRTAVSSKYTVGFDDLPENLREDLKTMADVYISWGVDLRAFNPEIESLYN